MSTRIAIISNRYPLPPYSGIPRFLYDFINTAAQHDIKISMLMPNLVYVEQAYLVSPNSSKIEEWLASKNNSPQITDVRDVIFDASNLEPFPQLEHLLSIKQLDSNQIIMLLNEFDLILVAGSVLLVYSELNLKNILDSVVTPKRFVLLYPLNELNHYLPPAVFQDTLNILTEVMQASDGVITCSKYQAVELRQYISSLMEPRIIPLGVSLPNELSQHRSSQIVMINRFGKFASHKNVPLIYKIYDHVSFKIPHVKIIVVGDGQASDQSQTRSGLVFAGKVSDESKNTILSESSVYLTLSTIEAFGISVLEAMSYGLPIVAFNSSAIPELVQHEVNGYLVDQSLNEKDRIKLFASYLIKVLDDRRLSLRLGQMSRRQAAAYSMSNMFQKYLQFAESD